MAGNLPESECDPAVWRGLLSLDGLGVTAARGAWQLAAPLKEDTRECGNSRESPKRPTEPSLGFSGRFGAQFRFAWSERENEKTPKDRGL